MSIRERHEADQAVDDLVSEAWIAARRSAESDGRESLEYVIELLVLILRELARSSGWIRAVIQGHAEGMRERRRGE